MKLVKAYNNAKFLNGDDARGIRILAEYLEPATRFRRKDIRKAIIFFGSARINKLTKKTSRYYRDSVALAEKLARWTTQVHARAERYHICTGGGPGIMEAVHEGAAKVDRKLNIGLNISLPFEQHVNPHVMKDHALEFHYFFMRKFWFLNLAHAAVIFPGGFGTLDELFELLTLTQTGKSAHMPIILYGKKFWEETIDFKGLARLGLISKEDLKLFKICDSVTEAFDELATALQAKPRRKAPGGAVDLSKPSH